MAESDDVKRYELTGNMEWVRAEDYDALAERWSKSIRMLNDLDVRHRQLKERLAILEKTLAGAKANTELARERHRKLRGAATKILHEISNSPKRHFGYFTGRAVQISDDDIEIFRRALEADKEAGVV